MPGSFFAAMDLQLTLFFLLISVLTELIAGHKRNIFCIIYSHNYLLLSIALKTNHKFSGRCITRSGVHRGFGCEVEDFLSLGNGLKAVSPKPNPHGSSCPVGCGDDRKWPAPFQVVDRRLGKTRGQQPCVAVVTVWVS